MLCGPTFSIDTELNWTTKNVFFKFISVWFLFLYLYKTWTPSGEVDLLNWYSAFPLWAVFTTSLIHTHLCKLFFPVPKSFVQHMETL